MTLFSLLEDKVGPGIVNTPEELCDHRGHHPVSNRAELPKFLIIFYWPM